MTSLLGSTTTHRGEFQGITVPRGPGSKRNKMADDRGQVADLEPKSSICIDSILSQDESRDIVSMMVMADELDFTTALPSFYTSTQMGHRDQRRRPSSPPLSPLPHVPRTETHNRFCGPGFNLGDYS